MISIEEALDNILNFISVLEMEEKPLLDCLGQVLAEDVYASFNVPAMDNSAMDGYAVQAGSISEASNEHPRILRVIGELPAGAIPDSEVVPGTAIRIMTGASMPEGADVVVPFEATDELNRKKSSSPGAEIGICAELLSGSNVRRKGEDIVGERSGIKWLSSKNCLFEEFFHLLVGFPPDIHVIVISQETWLQFSVGGYSQAVAVSAELRVVLWAHDLNLRSVETVLFPVVHPPGDDRL